MNFNEKLEKGQIGESMLAFISIVACIWAASALRRRDRAGRPGPSAGLLAKRALWWGILLATALPALAIGVAGLAHGQNVPSPFVVVLCVGVSALTLFGHSLEMTGNLIADTLILSVLLAASCLALVNGLAGALSLAAASPGRWFLCCLFLAVAVRAVLWVKEGC